MVRGFNKVFLRTNVLNQSVLALSSALLLQANGVLDPMRKTNGNG